MDSIVLNIRADHRSPRLTYVMEQIAEWLGAVIRWNDDGEKHISIGGERLGNSVHFLLSEILLSSELPPPVPPSEGESAHSMLFPDQSDLGFCLPAAVFFMISRAEEYADVSRDNHGRVMARNSAAARLGFGHLPIVDIWVNRLRNELNLRFPQLRLPEPGFEILPTFDIDSAFAFKNKGPVRTAGGFAKDIVRMDFSNFIHRIRSLIGKHDPYDVYSWLEDFLDKHGLNRKYFFLVSDFGEHDKNVPHQSRRLQALVKSLSTANEVGVHPGYWSKDDIRILHRDTGRVSNAIGAPVHSSRQHYLRMDLPLTYEKLIMAGIEHDYTMGWAETPGFRAGTSRPFRFFNLITNEVRPLTVHPFAVMDATLRFYQNLSPEQAIQALQTMEKTLREIGGRMVLLWHNESLSDYGQWAGWKQVFEEFIRSSSAAAPD